MSKLLLCAAMMAMVMAALCVVSVHAAMQLPSEQAAEHHAPVLSSPAVVTSLSVGTRSGAQAMHAPSQRLLPLAHEEAAHDELVDNELQSFIQQQQHSDHPMSRTSSPFLHEIKTSATADAEEDLSLDDELMVRVEGAETAKEIRDKLKPYLHPQTHSTLQAEPLPPLVSQAQQRALRTAHMKHVLEMKYNKLHARSRAAADAAADSASTAGNVTSVTKHVVQKSVEDARAYRFITLDNGLRAVLVSDPNTTKAAAAIDVGNGYLSDPAELPGLAHFLEHMLFLGTDKYPSEAGYADFIESHGGFSNAYTAMENTNYYFDILPNHLTGALDRFAQFFIAPKLSEDTTTREAGAVDQEHMKNLQSDAWRTNRLLQDVASRSHPYSKFGTGCRRTLSVRPRAEMVAALRKFWSEHYTAGNLILSVLGSESLDQLQATVDKYFSAIKPSPAAGNFKPLAGTGARDVFNSSVLGSELFVNTVEDSKFLALIFPLESQFPSYRKQSLSYLRGLLEQRGTNSLLKQLKARGWSTGIQLGIDAGTSAFATIQFSVDLTSKGGEHIDEIVGLFFATMEFIARTGVEQWRYQEMSVISNLTFTYKDKEQPSGYISKLASNLRHYPPEDLLVGGKLFLEFDAAHIKALVQALNPRNMMLMLGGKELNHAMRFKEQWYGIEYDVVKIAEKRLQKWVRAAEGKSKSIKRAKWAFALPAKSAFIPSKLRVAPALPTPVPRPIILYESARNESEISGAKRLWYSEDLEFRRPHGHVVMRMYVPSIYASPRNYLLTNIFSNLLEDQMDEDLYAALVAGFSSHFRVGTCYLDLIFSGYNSGLVSYGESIARIMNPAKGFRPDKLRFEVYKETLLNSYLNKKYDAPHKQSSVLLNTLLDPKVISQYDMVRTLEQISFEDVVSWPKVLFSDMSLESYVHGNVSPSAARKLLKIFVANLPFKTTSASFVNVPTRNHYLPRPRLGQVREDVAVQMFASNPSETNSAIVKYWQFGMGGVEGKLYSELLSLIAQKPIFHQLRTKEQLGYIVWSSADNRLDVSGFKVQVQSGRKTAAYLNDRIDAFVLDFQSTLLNMTQAQFEVYVETLMMSKLQSPVSMAVQTAWFWQEISKQEFIFQRKEIELYLLNATQIVNRQGFQNFVQKLFYISDARNPGVQSCETRGGGALSVRVESPNPRPAVAAVAGAPNPALPVKTDESKIVGTVRAVPRPGGKKKAKGPSTSPKAQAKAKAKAPKLHKPIIVAEAQVQGLAAVAPSTATKSLLEHGTELDADAEADAGADSDAEAQAESETAAMQRELDSLDMEEASLDADLGELDGEVAAASFLELSTEVDAAADAPKKKAAPRRQFIKGAGPFAEAPKAGKALSVSSLDQTVLIQTRTRDGSLYQLNATQSALHVYTDSLMLYPRGRYEPPPEVKNLLLPNKAGKAASKKKQKQAKVKAAAVPPMAKKATAVKTKQRKQRNGKKKNGKKGGKPGKKA